MRYFWCASLFIVTGVNTMINPSNAVIGLDSFAVVERRAAHCLPLLYFLNLWEEFSCVWVDALRPMF